MRNVFTKLEEENFSNIPLVGAVDNKNKVGIIINMEEEEEYTEEMLEAVKTNFDYLSEINPTEVATFLENLADSLYDGELITQLASAIRDVEEGVV